jgi:hypothetical protein
MAAVAGTQSATAPKRRCTAKHKHHSAKHRANCAIIEEAIAREITEHMALLGNAINPDTGASAEYNELVNSSAAPLWIAGNIKEIRRLLATKSICFFSIKTSLKASSRRTCASSVPTVQKKKTGTIGGDHIIFHGEVSTKAADIKTVKAHLNSVL